MNQYLKPKNNKIGKVFRAIGAHLSALFYFRNFIFCCRYPFMKLTNSWDGSFLGYKYTWYDEIPDGWCVAFGQQLLDDIVDALKQDNIPKRKWRKSVRWEQIKEKYGTLRLYCSTTEKVSHVLAKYEYLSMGYCIKCGKPAKYMCSGWIAYVCDEHHESGDKRLSKDDIPYIVRLREGAQINLDIKSEYGVDLETLWGLSK